MKSQIAKIMDPRELCIVLVDSWSLSKLPTDIFASVQSFFPSYDKVARHIIKYFRAIRDKALNDNDGKTCQVFYDFCLG